MMYVSSLRLPVLKYLECTYRADGKKKEHWSHQRVRSYKLQEK